MTTFSTMQRKADTIRGDDLHVKENEILGIVGESGCGKSTLGRSILQMLKTDSGSVIFKGKDIANLPLNKWKELRSKLQIIFQDPYSALNPN